VRWDVHPTRLRHRFAGPTRRWEAVIGDPPIDWGCSGRRRVQPAKRGLRCGVGLHESCPDSTWSVVGPRVSGPSGRPSGEPSWSSSETARFYRFPDLHALGCARGRACARQSRPAVTARSPGDGRSLPSDRGRMGLSTVQPERSLTRRPKQGTLPRFASLSQADRRRVGAREVGDRAVRTERERPETVQNLSGGSEGARSRHGSAMPMQSDTPSRRLRPGSRGRT
jgi:hypothetical protein